MQAVLYRRCEGALYMGDPFAIAFYLKFLKHFIKLRTYLDFTYHIFLSTRFHIGQIINSFDEKYIFGALLFSIYIFANTLHHSSILPKYSWQLEIYYSSLTEILCNTHTMVWLTPQSIYILAQYRSIKPCSSIRS